MDSKAEVSIKVNFFFSANFTASSLLTFLKFSKSILLPRIKTMAFSSAYSLTSEIHFSILSKVIFFVIS